MKPIDCGDVRERIPGQAREHHADMGAAFDVHLRVCADCRAELELARMIYGTRPQAPAALLERIRTGVRERGEPLRHPAWGLTAAAIAALALGIGLAQGDRADVVAPAFAQELSEVSPWDAEDGLVAGAPVLDDLSDADLTMLLDDLSSDAEGM